MTPRPRSAYTRRSVIVLIAVMAMLMTMLAGVAYARDYSRNGTGREFVPDAGARSYVSSSSVRLWLTVLHNNDGESALVPDGDEGGVARFAQKRVQAEWEATRQWRQRAIKGTIFVSSGDNFLASPAWEASVADGVFYDALALDRLNYDAIILGNHDFDFGPDTLEAFIREGFRRPGIPKYLSANLDFSLEPGLQDLVNRRVIAKSTVVRERQTSIGIVGATTENLPFITSTRNVIVNEVAPAAQAEIDKLRRRGVNHIVFVSHLQGVDEDIMLAEELVGVDVMIAGGGDELLANDDDLLLPSDQGDGPDGPYPLFATGKDGAMIPVVTTSGSYGYVGRLTVGFDWRGRVVEVDEDLSGPLRVVSKSVGPDGVFPNSWLKENVEEPVAEFIEELDSIIVGNSEVDLDGRRSAVRSVETNEGNLIADSQLWQARELADEFGVNDADVAVQNGGGIRNDDIIPAGPISLADTFDMVPFGNSLVIFEDFPRTQFKEILENGVSVIPPDGDITGVSGTGRFLQIAGFTMEYDSSEPPGSRVEEVILADNTVLVTGGNVVAGPPINVVVNNFTAGGGDEFDWGGEVFTPLGVSYQQALANFIEFGLSGLITAVDYPEGGQGRIVNNSPAL